MTERRHRAQAEGGRPAIPPLRAVSSTAVRRVGYDPGARELYVEFRREHEHAVERLYAYAGVPAEVHRALLAADSIGRYVNAVVKPAYAARELR